jgi:hypothetical protein
MAKARSYHSPIIEKLLKESSLKCRLRTTNHMLILSYLIDCGYIPDGPWSDEKDEKYGESIEGFVRELTAAQIKEFEQWEKDGKPK